MSRPLIRNPIVPMVYNETNAALAKIRELLIDETNKLYIKNANGTVTAITSGGTGGGSGTGDGSVHIVISQADYDALSDEEKNNGSIYLIYDAEDEPIESFLCTISQEDYDKLSTEEKNNGTLYFITDGEEDDAMFMTTLTQEQYEALSSEEKNNNTLYLIKDAEQAVDNIAVINSEQYRALTDEQKASGLYFVTDGRPDVEDVINNSIGAITARLGSDLVLSNTNITIVPLSLTVVNTNSSIFGLLPDGGIELYKNGNYIVSANLIYRGSMTVGKRVSVSVYKKNDPICFGGTMITDEIVTDGQCYCVAVPKVVQCSAGDIIYLKCNDHGGASTLTASEGGSYLTIQKI